jgi:hypothetical protein
LSCLGWWVMWENEFSFFVDHVATCGWQEKGMTLLCHLLILRRFLFVGKLESLFSICTSMLQCFIFFVVIEWHVKDAFGKKGSQHSCLETQSKEANICASIMEMKTIFTINAKWR